MGRSRRNSAATDGQNLILEVALPPEYSDVPSTSSAPSQSYMDANSNVAEDNDDNIVRSEPDFFMTSRILGS
jgi:hypothetical protein